MSEPTWRVYVAHIRTFSSGGVCAYALFARSYEEATALLGKEAQRLEGLEEATPADGHIILTAYACC